MNEQIIIDIDVLYLKAASLFAGKNDVRQNLNGVYFNLENGCIQATNGHVAFTTKPNLFASFPKRKGFIMPNELIKQILLIKPFSKEEKFRALQVAYNKGAITATLGGITVQGKEIEGKFPNLCAVYPLKESNNKTKTYNANYINLAAKATKLLKPIIGKDAGIDFNLSDNSSILSIDNLVHIIIMGMKNYNPFKYFEFKSNGIK
ncbi:hypothetical protein NYR72_10125 [Actinobacillus equuli subsp. haemolyticus]|uniref:hypothetical protein n=1 Tax=Actinobacillus equuli TaxID=718 RepID=UPI0024182E4F|nr:hypothetical protein [Actinobacillus equuli]MDG4948848.1 hypothetical protein [Actinobacillus equuli subsp. haemolyticus]